MTRDQLIETMAWAMCDYDYEGNSAPFTGDIMWGDERIRVAYIARATAALTALEAAGMRVVPVEPNKAMVEAFQWGTVLPGEIGRGTNAAVYRAMVLAAQEDSTSE